MDDDREDDIVRPDTVGDDDPMPGRAPLPAPGPAPSPTADRRPRRSTLRIDDRARSETAERLSAHLSAGRLDLYEYEERVALVYAAKTEADLAEALVDLPPITIRADRSKHRRVALGMLQGWAGLAVLFITIWALTGAGYFWPVWPMLGTGIATFPSAFAVARGRDDDRDHRERRDRRRHESRERRRNRRHR